MKKSLLPLLISATLLLASCGANNNSGSTDKTDDVTTSSSKDTSNPSEDKGVDADKVIENFVNKIKANNYVMNIKDISKLVMVDENQYYIDYIEAGIRDEAIFTINENETFQAKMIAGEIQELSFVSNQKAAIVTSEKNLNYLLNVSGGNIMNLFYNDPDNPLDFYTVERTREYLIEFFAPLFGYGPTVYSRIQDFHFTFDKEDMSSLHVFAEVSDDTYPQIVYPDIDIDITFGNATANETIARWIARPILPEAKTTWSDSDLMAIGSVFDQQYISEVIPFPTFASYTFLLDLDRVLNENILYITDKYATYEDSIVYINELVNNGFSAVKDYDEDGKLVTYYRKLLSTKYDYYSSITLDNNENGLVIICREYFKSDKYYTLIEINDLIMDKGYPYLVESDNILSWRAIDIWKEEKNATFYFYDYDMYLDVTIEYSDVEALNTYIDKYVERLLKDNFKYLEGEDYYQSEDGKYSFRWADMGDGIAKMLFKHEHKMTVSEIVQIIENAGFPQIDLLSGDLEVSGRDLVDNIKFLTNQDYVAYLSVDITFENNTKRDEFLDDYTGKLEDAGYIQRQSSETGEYFYDDDLGHEFRLSVVDCFIKTHFIK